MSDRPIAVPLSDLATVNPSRAPAPSSPNEPVSFIAMSDVSEGGAWINRQERPFSSVKQGFTSFADDDVLVAKITPCLENGKGCHARDLVGGIGFGSTEFHVLRAASEVSPRFLFHWSQSPLFRERAKVYMTGSAGQQRVGTEFFDRFLVPALPLAEQRRIAEILDTADEAIRLTELAIAKLEDVREGLLHDLLTCGLDENGELRDPRRHPDRFQDSPFGQIPRTWSVATVESLLAPVDPAMRSGPFGSSLLKGEMVDDGIPIIGIDNVYPESFRAEYSRFVTPHKAAELARYRLYPSDLLVTIMGAVGRACLVPEDIGHALSSKHVWALTLDADRYSPYLACAQVNRATWVARHFAREEQGGVMSAIRSDALRSTLLPVPPIEEQARMEGVLRAAAARVEKERSALEKMIQARLGLSSDLLSGRVRVAISEEPIA
jgi:type I restriction enzyme S subunit